MDQLDVPRNVKLAPKTTVDDLQNLIATFIIERGMWAGASYTFDLAFPDEYPHQPPKVTLRDKIYHPNINYDGSVCLNILKESWRPVLSIEQVIHGLSFLFVEPNPEDPLNHSAAEVLRKDRPQFEQNVTMSLQGNVVDGINFPANYGHSL